MPTAPEKAVDLGALLAAALTVASRAYAPYSRFRVGAALSTAQGTVVTGCNVENASYGLGVCAERNAVAAMIAAAPGEHSTLRAVSVIAVASPDASPCFPCGACRQVLREFGCRQVVVQQRGLPCTYPLEALLPHAFGPEDLHR